MMLSEVIDELKSNGMTIQQVVVSLKVIAEMFEDIEAGTALEDLKRHWRAEHWIAANRGHLWPYVELLRKQAEELSKEA